MNRFEWMKWRRVTPLAVFGRMVFLLFALFWSAGLREVAAQERDVVTDYETRLEEIAEEISAIRRELEGLVEELVEPEVARVFVFLASAPSRIQQAGVTLSVDGATVFSRPFTPAEQDVLRRELPLELADLRLEEGDHQAILSPLGAAASAPARFTVERGATLSWIGRIGESGVEWLVE